MFTAMIFLPVLRPWNIMAFTRRSTRGHCGQRARRGMDARQTPTHIAVQRAEAMRDGQRRAHAARQARVACTVLARKASGQQQCMGRADVPGPCGSASAGTGPQCGAGTSGAAGAPQCGPAARDRRSQCPRKTCGTVRPAVSSCCVCSDGEPVVAAECAHAHAHSIPMQRWITHHLPKSLGSAMVKKGGVRCRVLRAMRADSAAAIDQTTHSQS